MAKISGVISEGLESGRLVARDSGQGSPCLDLARLNNEVKETYVIPFWLRQELRKCQCLTIWQNLAFSSIFYQALNFHLGSEL